MPFRMGRGMAIQVLEVAGDMVLADEQSGQTQDFVMVNHPAFFARNVKGLSAIGASSRASRRTGRSATLQGALTGGDWNPLHWHWREMLAVARIAGQLPAHPASNTYFSMAPIRFGDYVVKYRGEASRGSPRLIPGSDQAIGIRGRRNAIGAR